MSQVITNAFEQYWQSSLAAEQPVVLDEFILADIPDLDITSPIDPGTGLPPESQIVHRQNVDQRGRINNNAVAYTIVMDTTVGDFSFNAMYLRNKQNGVIGMIVYKGRETKLKTDQTTGQTGNSLVKSMLMGYDQAAEATLTHVDAGTWQIDYAARLRGQDEDLRQLASQLYGHHTFIGDGFKVVQQDGGHQVTQGVAIVGGLRIELKQPEVIYPGTKPIGVWVDVHRAGSLLSEHQNHFTIITSVADLTDHVDSSGYQHYVAKLGTVQADNTVVDGRGQGGSSGSGSIPDTFALWKRSIAEAGYDLIGQFGTSHTIESAEQVLLNKDGTEVYQWQGELPKYVGKNDTTENSGGVGDGAWTPKSYESLRAQLADNGGASLVGPGVMVRGGDRFSIMQGRSGEHRQDTLTRGLAIELNEPITGSGYAGATNTYMFNRLFISDDKVDAVTDGTPGSKVDGLIVQHQFGGAGTRGGRHAAEFMLTQQGATEPDNTDRNYVGVVGYCATTSGDGGTNIDTDKRGAYFGGNFFTTIKNAQNVSHANGCESNVLIDAASSVYYRSGYSAVSAGDNQATKYDAAFSVGALGTVGAQWLDGLLVGVQNGRNPVSRSIIRGESAIMQSLASFSGTIPGGLIVSDTDDRFNFRIDRLEMHYANASLKLGAKTAVNTPFIDAYTDATGNRAGRIIFTGTASPAGNGVCNVQFRQTTVREIVPSSPNAYSCGTASLPWSGIFTQTAPTITSDENYKTKPLAITDVMLDAASEVDWVQYQYLDRVEAKGPDGARWHFGAVAQRYIEAFARHGLDAHDYAFLCYDEWGDQWGKRITNEGATVTKTRTVQRTVVETVTREFPVHTEQEDGSVVVTMTSREALVPKLEKAFLYNEDGTPRMNDDGNHAYELFEVMVDVEEEYTEPAEPEYEDVLEIPAGSRYGIRYEEALALEAALQRRNYQRLIKRIEALEAN